MNYFRLFIILVIFIAIFYSIFAVPRKNREYINNGNLKGVKKLKIYDIVFASLLFLIGVFIVQEIKLKLIYILIFVIHVLLNLLVTKTSDTGQYNFNRLNIFVIIGLIIKAIFSPYFSFNDFKEIIQYNFIFVIMLWLTLFILAVPTIVELLGI